MISIRRSLSQFIRLNSRHGYHNVSHSAESDLLAEGEKKLRKVYKDMFELTERRTNEVLEKNPFFLFNDVDVKQVAQSFQLLKSFNFTNSEILKRPNVLRLNKTDLTEIKKILEEFCFEELRIGFFVHLYRHMNAPAMFFKRKKIIAQDANVSEGILRILDVELDIPQKFTDDMPLLTMKRLITKHYVEKKFELKGPMVDKRARGKVKRRSFKSIVETANILQKQLSISGNDILEKNLLRACPRNLQQMIDALPLICGQEKYWKHILLKVPAIVTRDFQDVVETVENIQKFGYTKENILACPQILLRGCDKVYNDLVKFQKLGDLKVLSSSPKVLQLVMNQDKAASRMKYLKKLEIKAGSLYRLTVNQACFEKYVRDGIDPTKGSELLIYLSKVFKKDENYMRKMLKRHPYWQEIPLIDVTATVGYLRYKKFSDDEIGNNFFLLLYPVSQIESKLLPLLEKNSAAGQETNANQTRLSNANLLNVCLYQIELDYHFTGDGVWSSNRKPNKTDSMDSDDAWKQQKAANSLSI